MENGEMRQYDFPGAVQTFIYGISDTTGELTGNFIDEAGVRRGFSGDNIVEVPGASATFADFINSKGGMVGSYIDSDGIYHPYVRNPDGRFVTLELPQAARFEFFFVHGINDAWNIVGRIKAKGGDTFTRVGSFQFGLKELKFPGSVRTEGWNINQDGSVVGHYDTADGRRHGFIARPATQAESEFYSNIYPVTLTKGLNLLSLPLATPTPLSAKELAGLSAATVVITLDAVNQRFVAWTPNAPDNGFTIEGGQAYIVNVPQHGTISFVGARWTNQTQEDETSMAPSITTPQETWAFVVSGHLDGKQNYDGFQVTVRNIRTNGIFTTQVENNYFAAATADFNYNSVIQSGDKLELFVTDTDGNIVSEKFVYTVKPNNLSDALLTVNLNEIGTPHQNRLLQNYPNPFNPETWIPYQLSEDASVTISIYDATGSLVRNLSLGLQSAGFYYNRDKAAYWDGRNTFGERVSSGIYFYQLTTPTFKQSRRLVILK